MKKLNDELLEELMKCEKFINKFAKLYSYAHDFEDLKQVGSLGLEKALRKYDSNLGATFSSYAYMWIKGEILDYLSKDKSIIISKEIQSLSREIDKCSDILRQKLGREPTIKQIAFFLEKPESKIIEALGTKELVKSTDYSLNEDDDYNLYDLVPYYEKAYNEEYMDLHQVIEDLPEPEKTIIKLRYFEDYTQKEVSEVIGFNQVRVSRYETKTLEKLKRLVA